MDPWSGSSSSRDEWTTPSHFHDALSMEPISFERDGRAGEQETEDAEEDSKKRLQEFSETVTLHGARYVINPKYHGLRRYVNINLHFLCGG